MPLLDLWLAALLHFLLLLPSAQLFLLLDLLLANLLLLPLA